MTWLNENGMWCCYCSNCQDVVMKNKKSRINAFIKEKRVCKICGYKIRKGNFSKGHVGYWKGKFHSEEWKRKMSEVMEGKSTKWLKGRKLSEIHKQNIKNGSHRGIDHQMFGKHHNQESIEKMMESKSKIDFRRKQFILPNGKIVYIHGYEPQTINKLLNEGVSENVMCFTIKDGNLTIHYKHEEKSWYFPDLFLKDRNMIVETKSLWTWKKYKNINLEKIKASLSSGYDYRLIIWDNKGKIIWKDIIYRCQ